MSVPPSTPDVTPTAGSGIAELSVALADAAASYARISDNDGAGAGVGTSDQHRRNNKRAKAEGLTVVHELTDDDRSAHREDVIRDDYEKLLGLIRAGKIRYVLTAYADRLHRRMDQAEAFIRLARQRNVVVITASGQRYNFDSAEGRKAFRSAATDAAYESEHRAERVADSRERRALEGAYGGGTRPFGWGVETRTPQYMIKADGTRKLRPPRYTDDDGFPIWLDMGKHNPAEAEEIRRWKRDLLAGVDQAQVMRSIPMSTVTGNPHWDSRTMWQILLSPRTSGHSVYRGEIVKRKAWEPILTDDERESLRTLHENPARKTTPGNTPRWLGSLIYQCGRCNDGTTMTCRYTNGGQRVYRCQAKGHCQRDGDDIDWYVQEVVIERLKRDDLADLIQTGPKVDVAALRDKVQILEQQKIGDAIAAAKKKIDREQLYVLTAEADREIDELNAQLKAATAESPLADFIGVDDVRKVWHSRGLGRQREILRMLADITLMPVGRGRRPTSAPRVDPTTVVFTPAGHTVAAAFTNQT